MKKVMFYCCLVTLICFGSAVLAKDTSRKAASHDTKALSVAEQKALKDANKATHAQRTYTRSEGTLDQGGEDCASAVVISSLPYSDSGNTCENDDDYDAVCPYEGSTSPDVTYSYSPASDIQVTLSLCGGSTDYDTKLYVLEGDAVIACNDDACQAPLYDDEYNSLLYCVELLAGHTYCIVVDGYDGECGDYTLDVFECGLQCDCGDWCNEVGAVLPDEAFVSTTVDVDVEYHITDVNLCLDIDHTFIGDLYITLTSPSGTEVVIWDGECGGEEDIPCITFDDEASGDVACPPIPGSAYWADGSLSGFDGENAVGTWTLAVEDQAAEDEGTLNGWCLSFEYDYILAVDFGSLSASAGDNSVTLNWNTNAETSNDRFEIMRGGIKVGETDAMNNAEGSSYAWTDANVTNGTTYSYTLIAVDLSGNRQELATVEATPRFENATVSDYALHQNYPNPFNPETNISFDLVESGLVTLNVYNMLGQQVAALVNGSLEAGRHTVAFDAADLPSGLYLYRIEAGDFSAMKKMVLMK